MSDLISRKAVLKHIEKIRQGAQMMDDIRRASTIMNGMDLCEEAVRNQPSAQPEQTKMIKEIREWINSGNRGSADYFIVDKIEEIINKYE